MSKRKQKTPVQNKGIPQFTSGYVSVVPTSATATLDLRGKVAYNANFVDIKIIIPNRDGGVSQFFNRFWRK